MDIKIEQYTLSEEPIKISMGYVEAIKIANALRSCMLDRDYSNYPVLANFLESLTAIILDPHFD